MTAERSGRVVIVTGGSRGIGRACVEAFHQCGDTVATCATTEQNARRSGADIAVACDVASPHSVNAFVERVVQERGRIDVLINNAGLSGSNPLEEHSDDDLWHRIIAVNLHGPYHMCKSAMPHLQDRTGRIINIASVLALRGAPDQSAYSAAKHGVVGLTRSLAHVLGPRGITVNAICPGWVRSEMAEERFRCLGIDEATTAQGAPLGRIVEPWEVAAMCVYLASMAAGSVTGQALPIDCGGAV